MIFSNFLIPPLVLASFILSLLVSISLPIVKDITLFTVEINADVDVIFGLASADAAANIVFGVWGYCFTDFSVSADFRGEDVTSFEGSDYCSDPKLGYTFDEKYEELIDAIPGNKIDASTIRNAIATTTAFAFVLHVVVAALIFIDLLFALLLFFKPESSVGVCAMLGTSFTALLCTIVFLIDVIFVAVLRNKLESETDNEVTASWGNGVWMMLGATIAMWLAVVGSCVSCCRVRKSRRF